MAGDSSGSTNTSSLPAFNELGVADQAVVQWRSEGNTYAQIVTGLQSEFGIAKSIETVRAWFRPGGRLEAAYFGYNDQLGDSALKEAAMLLKRATNRAAIKVVQTIDGKNDNPLALKAAFGTIDKFMPDAHTLDLRIDDARTKPEPLSPELKASIERQRAIQEAGEAALAAKENEND